ncbi:Contactin-3 [Mactra antiquata]
MKLFRLRFILLGLLLCLYHVWCLTCGTEFDDAATSAYLADVVIIGTLTQKLPPNENLYNATVTVSKSRNVLKGAETLRVLNLLRRGGGSSLLTVGQFGNTPNAEFCYADVKRGTEYIFFLKQHYTGSTFFLSAIPISEDDSTYKRAKKDIKKILCNKKKCVKLPEFDPRKEMKSLKVNTGKKMELNCRLHRKPLPNAVFTWLKDERDVNTIKSNRLRIKTSKKGSRLSIKRASVSDSGVYKCIARNIEGSVMQQAEVIVSDGVLPPEPGTALQPNVQQQVRSTLRLTCDIIYQTAPETKFRWQKDGIDIDSGDGVSIRSKGVESKLRKTKLTKEDQGIYTCIAENQAGGKLSQRSNVTVYSEAVKKPEVGIPELRDVDQKHGTKMVLTCKIKEETIPATTFKWYKDGREINSGSKGPTIQNTRVSSTLTKDQTILPDEGNYTCIAENPAGTVRQHARVRVIGGPQKTVPCGPENAQYCLNNGTCLEYPSIGKIFCTCPKTYKGNRCEMFWLPDAKKISEGDRKLAQDRAFVIVGIISGILLFFGICVASYFLAKRRRDRFHRRRNQQRVNGHIEDIPQVYRPLIGCDDIDGLTKKMNGVLIHKETQTTESCFLGSDNTQLYISPIEGYVGNDGNDRGSRSRKTAVSLEEDPRNWVNRNNSHNETMNENDNRNFGDINDLGNKTDNRCNDLNVDSDTNDHLNDLSPRHKPIQRENDPAVGANPHVANIPSPKSTLPPAINLDTSDEEIPGDGTPLTPLHISEDEDNSDIFKKCKPKTADNKSKSEEDNLFKKCKPKNIAEPNDPKVEKEPEVGSVINPRPQRSEKPSNIANPNPIPSRHDRQPHMNVGRQGNPYKSNRDPRAPSGPGRRDNIPRSGPPPNIRRRDHPGNPGKHPPRREDQRGSRPKESNKEAVASPENNTAVSSNGLGELPIKPVYTGAENKPQEKVRRGSDSSSSTEGCDSPNTAWLNSQEFSDHSPEPSKSWNERGSPEASSKNPPPYFNLFSKLGDKGSVSRGDRRDEDGRNNKIRPSMKDKFSIAI